MLNKINAGNRRMIMSAAMLNVYQNDSNTTHVEGNTIEAYEQTIEQLSEQDENDTYVLGYN